MIREVVDFERYIAILGFSNVKIKNVNDFFNLTLQLPVNICIQFFNADLIASQEHLFFAAVNALKSFETKTNISKSLAIETLLFASAIRQIKKSISMLGINPNSQQLAVLIIAKTLRDVTETLKSISKLIPGKRDDTVLALNEKKFKAIKKLFNVSDLELQSKIRKDGFESEALINLVIEHMALLSTQS